jgi:GT2 family glycosyltransferase
MYILTLNWNGEDKLKELAPSLEAAVKQVQDAEFYSQELEEKFKIRCHWLVKDNGSKDGSVEHLKNNYGGSLHVYEVGHNRDTFAQGVNFLWDKSLELDNSEHGEPILLLNNDIVIKDPKSLVKMLRLMYSSSDNFAVGARLLFKNTNKLQHAGVIFSERYNMLPYHFRPGEVSDANAKKNRYFQAVTAACCLVRSDWFSQMGLMDEGFRWAFDDIDMCLSLCKMGGKIAYCGETEIYHEESASLKKNPVKKMFMNQNVAYFRKKWSGKYEIDHQKYLNDPNYMVIK